MGSSIIFLGTGSQSYVVGRQLRYSGGIIIKSDDNQLHIDPGPSSLLLAKMYKVNLRENTALLVSHNHIGHCNDVNAVISAMTLDGIDRKGVLVSNQTIMNGNEKEKPYLTDFFRNCVEKAMVLKAEQRIGINDIEIIGLKTNHSDAEAIGFKIITPYYALSYTSDTSYTAGIAEQYKGSDILILNVVAPFESESKGNLNSEDAVNIIMRVKPQLAIITHFGEKMINSDPISQARIIQNRTGVQTITAIDGLMINPESYSAKAKQKRLNSF